MQGRNRICAVAVAIGSLVAIGRCSTFAATVVAARKPIDTTSYFEPAGLGGDGLGTWILTGPTDSSSVSAVRSVDGGLSWLSPVPVGPILSGYSVADTRVAADGAGGWAVVWTMRDNEAPYTDPMRIFVATSADSGATWGNAQEVVMPVINPAWTTPRITRLGPGHFLAYESTSMDPAGNPAGSSRILGVETNDGGQTWADFGGPAFPHSDAVRYQWPVIAVSESGRWMVVLERGDLVEGPWNNSGSGGFQHLALQVSTSDDGVTWSAPSEITAAPEVLSVNTVYFGPPYQLTPGRSGRWLLSPSREVPYYGLDRTRAAVSLDDGQTWTDYLNVEASSAPMGATGRDHSFAGAGYSWDDDKWLYFWTRERPVHFSGPSDLMFSSTADGVSWSRLAAYHALTFSPYSSWSPAVGVDRDGSVLAAYPIYPNYVPTLRSVVSKLECPSTPASCLASDADSQVKVKNNGWDRDAVSWKLRIGDTAFSDDAGDPTAATRYLLCMYGPDNTLLYERSIDPGGTCGSADCWTSTARGFRLHDAQNQASSIKSARLDVSSGLLSGVTVKVAGFATDPPELSLPLGGSIETQLYNQETGSCWSGLSIIDRADENTLTAR